jgi:hypothetical protein
MVILRNGKMTTLSDIKIKLKIEIGTTALYLLFGRDIYNSDTDTIRPTAPNIISAQVLTTLHQIGGGGWTAARLNDFISLVQRGELLYLLVLDDGDEIYFGRTAPHMHTNMGAVR